MCSSDLLFLKREAVAGTIRDGDELPSRRVLSALLGVNPNTVQKAYRMLEEEGLIYTDGTNGKFVTADAAFIARRREEYLWAKAGAFAEEMRGAGVGKQELERLIREALPEEK